MQYTIKIRRLKRNTFFIICYNKRCCKKLLSNRDVFKDRYISTPEIEKIYKNTHKRGKRFCKRVLFHTEVTYAFPNFMKVQELWMVFDRKNIALQHYEKIFFATKNVPLSIVDWSKEKRVLQKTRLCKVRYYGMSRSNIYAIRHYDVHKSE